MDGVGYRCALASQPQRAYRTFVDQAVEGKSNT